MTQGNFAGIAGWHARRYPVSTMTFLARTGLLVQVALAAPALAQVPAGQPVLPAPYGPPPTSGSGAAAAPPAQQPAIPPAVQEPAVRVGGGGYCYLGAHPVDTSVAAGPRWHDTNGQHIHFYAPIDVRLFHRHGDCYQFTGDPKDFGYVGHSWSYWGAHPLGAPYAGWCFAVGGHHHGFGPWSRQFAPIGGYHYWNGPYDTTFWTYWPYWAHFYGSLYPQHYAGGKFLRDGRVAPPITHLPPPPGAGTPHGGPGWGPHAPGAGAPMPGEPQQPPAPAPPPEPSAPPRGTIVRPPTGMWQPAPSAPPPAAAAPSAPAPSSDGNGSWRSSRGAGTVLPRAR